MDTVVATSAATIETENNALIVIPIALQLIDMGITAWDAWRLEQAIEKGDMKLAEEITAGIAIGLATEAVPGNKIIQKIGSTLTKVMGKNADEVIAGAAKLVEGAKDIAPAKRPSNQAVLGRVGSYERLSDELGARRFDVPDEVWEKMTESERWTANQKFLDRMIARGDEIILSNPVKDIKDVSGMFRKELNYLIEEKGYRLTEGGTRLVK